MESNSLNNNTVSYANYKNIDSIINIKTAYTKSQGLNVFEYLNTKIRIKIFIMFLFLLNSLTYLLNVTSLYVFVFICIVTVLAIIFMVKKDIDFKYNIFLDNIDKNIKEDELYRNKVIQLINNKQCANDELVLFLNRLNGL